MRALGTRACSGGVDLPAPAVRRVGAEQHHGVVRDASGGVLPGVTVEAAVRRSSKASAPRSRTRRGSIRVVDLRPGTYTVTFTLPGFRR